MNPANERKARLLLNEALIRAAQRRRVRSAIGDARVRQASLELDLLVARLRQPPAHAQRN
jgi:hypothetical protein